MTGTDTHAFRWYRCPIADTLNKSHVRTQAVKHSVIGKQTMLDMHPACAL